MISPLPIVDVRHVIFHLGGVSRVAKLTGRSRQNVYNWITAGKFSAAVYLKMARPLERKGLTAPPALWGIEDDTREQAA